MSSTRVIDDGLVDKVNLLVPRYWLFRWDVLPFVVCYLALFHALYYADIYSTDYAKELANELEDPGLQLKVALAGIPMLLALQVLLFLMSQWNMALKCDLGYIRVNTVATASVVHVVAAKNMGKDRIVPVMMLRLPPSDPSRPAYANDTENSSSNQTVSIAGSKHRCSAKFFEYQKVKYEFDETERNSFVRCESPAQGGVSAFLTHKGHEQEAAVMMCLQKWGINEFDIPVPPFLDLYMENLTAPFFVFQVLCLFLWSLDDYWYYSAFTLLMLMFFEGMLCKQRLDGLLMLRQMRRPAMPVQVFRGGKWGLMSSEGIVPGDVVALTTVKIEEEMRQAQAMQEGQPEIENDDAGSTHNNDEIVLPCDALIVRGSCVVNEAMLTGESVPQIKETLSTCEDRDQGVVSIASGDDSALWKRHLVFGGTTLVQDAESHSGDEQSPCDLPRPPFGGCIAVVVRTGFSTTQGGLMRKILFATERVNATSTETVHFIAVLVVFAMMASAVVLKHGLVDESRNKFKLVLHCVMIITSVVPPELPMELSLAVTNSLAALSRHLVFCTEPFRIPFAGKLDILCFDKTGTLTKDKMILRGVVAPHDISFGSDSNAGTSSSGSGSASVQPQLVPECAAVLSSADSSSSSSSDKERFAIMKLLGGDDDSDSKKNKNGTTDAILATMAMCNSLFINKGVIQGDPMEVETHRSSGFGSLALGGGSGANNQTRPDLGIQTNPRCQMTVGRKHLYPFSSALKRMSVVVTIKKGDGAAAHGSDWVLTKGAPEVLGDMLAVQPAYYQAAYQYHMNRGKRVLALACKRAPRSGSGSGSNSKTGPTRAEVETGLGFLGFLLYDCDLKADTKSVIRELRLSNHRVMMITGDSPYTAADVGRRVNLTKSEGGVRVLRETAAGKLVWRDAARGEGKTTEEGDIDFTPGGIAQLASSHDLCVIGSSLACVVENSDKADAASGGGNHIARDRALQLLCPHVNIFARVSPAQKEQVITALKDSGLHTLMCGDGTNDVGALKAAHVGVSIVNDPEFESSIENTVGEGSSAGTASEKGQKKAKGTSARDRMSRALAELQKQEADPTIVKLGDASIASPFTARRTSIDSVLTVLRQGRCTLVTTIQVFKILALNCLVSAFMMSALYLRGLKQGDIQMTAVGLVTAGLFFFLSLAKPMEAIAPERPPPSVFSRSVILSIGGQFAVHMACLLSVLHMCEEHVSKDDLTMNADGRFHPNVVNSAVFVLSAAMQVNNFIVNYRGNPFTQTIKENTYLYRGVVAVYAVLVIVVGGQVEPLNDLLQISPFPNSAFQIFLLVALTLNFFVSYGVELVARKLE